MRRLRISMRAGLLAALLLAGAAGAEARDGFDCVVAKDGSGDFSSVQDAIDSAPESRTRPWRIFIKAGTYSEHVCIPEANPFISLIGEGRDRVTIADSRLCGGSGPHFKPRYGATVVSLAADVYMEGLTIDNSWGVERKAGPQALALYTNGDRTILHRCRLRSYQDTYLTSTQRQARHYLKDCEIEGAVDFIYGQGDVLFDSCTISVVRKSGGWIVAPCHDNGTRWGYVFLNCTITAPGNPADTEVWLGRPWHARPLTVFLNTTAKVRIPAEGWFDHMGGLPKLWADYNTMNADGTRQDLSRRRSSYYCVDENGNRTVCTAKNSLTEAEAARYTVAGVMGGNDNWRPDEVISSQQAAAGGVR